MGGNEVKLTFTGDSGALEQSLKRVGSSAEGMGKKLEETRVGFDRVGEGADEVDTKAMGFRDSLTGVQDTLGGVSALAKGPSFSAFLQLGAGIGDLGSGMYNFLVPQLKSTVTWLRAGGLQTAAMNVQAGIMRIGTLAWAGAQRVLNMAFLSSPITWIIAGVVALGVAVYFIATRTRWFQTIWNDAWGSIRNTAAAAWGWISHIPGWIGAAFRGIKDAIWLPFRFAFNLISDAWNNTVGRLQWTVPGWVPGIGGNTIGVPNLPHFHSGGRVPGAPGSEMLAVLQAGETVTPAGSGGTVLEVRSGSGSALEALLAEIISRYVRVHGGGDVQTAFGR